MRPGLFNLNPPVMPLGRVMLWFDWLGPITVIAMGAIIMWLILIGMAHQER
jgi:hypothetical protein